MSRRKQRNPRHIKRALGEMEETEESLGFELNSSEKDGSISDMEELADCDSSSPSFSDVPEAEGEPSSSVPQASDQEMGEEEPLENLREEATPPCDSEAESTEVEDSVNYKESETGDSTEDAVEPHPWNGPDELVLENPSPSGVSRVRAQTELPKGLTWGPYRGTFSGAASSPDRSEVGGALSLEVDEDCWLKNVTFVSCEFEANSVLYRKGDQIWCKTSQVIEQGDVIRAFLMAEPQAIPNFSIKEEPGETSQAIVPQPEFQLLPQQAGMAAILATAVINKDIFPCKDCGIWYRSERNLQAHLMYYCASRQSSTSPTLDEKPKDSYPNERVCPFPQCKKSCPSASSLEIHMRSHSGERPFVCLICLSAFTTKANCERHLKVHTDTLNGVCHGCGFISTTRDILYSHLVTNHMICQPGSKVEVYPVVKTLPAAKPSNSGVNQISSLLKCSLCGFLADSLASLQQHAIMHATASLPGLSRSSKSPSDAQKELSPDSLKNGDAKSPVSSSSSGMDDPPLKVHIKEEPDAPRPVSEAVSTSPEARDESALVPSPAVKIKTEISSPTPGSSPVPNELGAAAGGGTIIVPQYMFGHEAAPAIVPQASEILAKMSELVHSRLKQGQAITSVGFPGTPAPKGATCYECEITFNNINNYYVHKRLYCSGRHVSDENPGSGRKVKVHTVRAAIAPAMSAVDEQRVSPQQQEDTAGESSTSTVQIKVEEGAGTENEASGSGHASEGSQSPGLQEDAEEDLTRTVCEACNIRFSKHETYVVHKRFYCASRHDPPLRRSGVINKAGPPYTPQPAPRTRKRRKLYEIHGVSPADLTSPALLPLTRVEALPLMPGLIAAPTVPSPSSSPDVAEGPIDLSKKPRLSVESSLPLPAAATVVPLTDYHECTACQISFNSLESYLAHKKFSCPVAPLQQKALQQLQKMKSPLNASGKIGEDGVRIKVERRATLSPGSGSDSIQPVALPFITVADTKPLQQYTTSSVEGSPSASTTTCPYCPPNVVIRGDLLEHFRSVHGLLLAKPTPGHRLQTAFMELLLPARVQQSSSSENSLPSPPTSSTSPLQGQGLPRDTVNCKDAVTSSSSSSSSNGSPVSSTTPRPVLTSTTRPLLPSSPAPSLNPLAETRLPTHSILPGDKPMQPPKASLSSALPNGNHRFCRLCNIKFSSLSTFIAHKKYYCSSHAAEHVK